METFQDYLDSLASEEQKERFREVFAWMEKTFPELKTRIAWNQPMYTDHGTFIVAFSAAKAHMACSPETKGIEHFAKELDEAGIKYTSMLFRFPWQKPIPYDLLERIIRFNIEDKKDCQTFWRKPE